MILLRIIWVGGWGGVMVMIRSSLYKLRRTHRRAVVAVVVAVAVAAVVVAVVAVVAVVTAAARRCGHHNRHHQTPVFTSTFALVYPAIF